MIRSLLFVFLICIPHIAFSNPAACTAIICLSNIPGAVPMECRSPRQEYFIIQIWSPYYNAPATAIEREIFLRTCAFVPSEATTMESIIQRIQNKYGKLMYDPQT